jgi:hypothetical protein
VSPAGVVAVLGPGKLVVLPRVPAAEYAGVFVLAALLAAGLWIARRFIQHRAMAEASDGGE